MSQYIATARTNYFRVKDVEALKKELLEYGITPATWEQSKRGAEFVLDDAPTNVPSGSIALFSMEGWPSFDEDSTANRLELWEEDDVVPSGHESLHALIATHLVDGQVAIFMEVGFEKLRYLGGLAVAVNSAGETRRVDLEDIYELATQLTTEQHPITHAHA